MSDSRKIDTNPMDDPAIISDEKAIGKNAIKKPAV